ncbi:MAG: TolC family protein [Pedobacter sp.]|nr:MAG: TolC family protein [Pedobacter sp.]
MNKLSIIMLSLGLIPALGFAQAEKEKNISGKLTLEECISYALNNQPNVRLANIDKEIVEREINTQLADWLPQVRADGSYTRNLVIGSNVANIGGEPVIIRQGLNNASNVGLIADQAIYSNELLLASKAAKYSRQQVNQSVENVKINTITEVSKAFYDVLLSQEQLSILDGDIVRLEKQLNDAYAQFQSGLVDKIDYKRATISLNSSKAQRKAVAERLVYKKSYLNQLMGTATNSNVDLVFDDSNIAAKIALDTTAYVAQDNRIELQQLNTQRQLQQLNVSYYKLGFLPKVSAFYNYNLNYFNDNFSNLYDRDYPASQVGLRLSIPIFQGTKRIQSLRRAELQTEAIDITIEDQRKQINTEYDLALGTYKSNLNDWKVQGENEDLAKEVYETVKMQYDEGIKTYLDLITAETDLRTTQLNYLNSLYNLLSSKVDVQKAMGTLTPTPNN